MHRFCSIAVLYQVVLGLVVLATPAAVTFHYSMECQDGAADEMPLIGPCETFEAPCGLSNKTDSSNTFARASLTIAAFEVVNRSVSAHLNAQADGLSIDSITAQVHLLLDLGVRLQV